jgi:hypothetical protein
MMNQSYSENALVEQPAIAAFAALSWHKHTCSPALDAFLAPLLQWT